jgi:hypothetical protein
VAHNPGFAALQGASGHEPLETIPIRENSAIGGFFQFD